MTSQTIAVAIQQCTAQHRPVWLLFLLRFFLAFLPYKMHIYYCHPYVYVVSCSLVSGSRVHADHIKWTRHFPFLAFCCEKKKHHTKRHQNDLRRVRSVRFSRYLISPHAISRNGRHFPVSKHRLLRFLCLDFDERKTEKKIMNKRNKRKEHQHIRRECRMESKTNRNLVEGP